jgi:hypothetical protein
MCRQTQLALTDEPRPTEKRTVPCYCDRRQHALRLLGLPSPKIRALRDRIDARRFARQFGAIEFNEVTRNKQEGRATLGDIPQVLEEVVAALECLDGAIRRAPSGLDERLGR